MFLAGPLQWPKFLALSISDSVHNTCQFKVGFIWYLQCLSISNIWAILGLLGGRTQHLKFLSHVDLSSWWQCAIFGSGSDWYLKCLSKTNSGGHFRSAQWSNAEAVHRQKSTSEQLMSIPKCPYTQILVPRSYEFKALGTRSILFVFVR